MAVTPTQLSDWYQSQVNSGLANNGILTTGGVAPDPVGAKPDLNSSTPITTASQPSTYKGLSTASTQLTEPTKWNVTPEQTSQGQLKGILESGSPLMTQAKAQGLQTANQRGLLNSSIAAGAAQGAMIERATPLATQDAQTAAAAAQANQNVENAFKTTNAENVFNAQQNQYNTETAIAQNQYNKSLAAAENVYNQQIATAQQERSITSAKDTATANAVASITSNLNNAIAAVQTSQTMTQQAKEYSIAQLQKAYKNQISLLSAVGSVPDVSTLLSEPPTVEAPPPDYVAAPAPTQQPAQSSGGSVICTYYHSIGWMDSNTYAADEFYGKIKELENYHFMMWYRSWAIPFVYKLSNSVLLTYLCWPLVYCWAKEMEREIYGNTRGSIIGAGLMKLGNLMYKLSPKALRYV